MNFVHDAAGGCVPRKFMLKQLRPACMVINNARDQGTVDFFVAAFAKGFAVSRFRDRQPRARRFCPVGAANKRLNAERTAEEGFATPVKAPSAASPRWSIDTRRS